MMKNERSKSSWGLNFFGCSCCNSKARRRKAKHSDRQRERRQWKSDLARAY